MRKFTENQTVFVYNPNEPDLNGFGKILIADEVEPDDILQTQVNGSGENQEQAESVYTLAANRICCRCGCVICEEHNDFNTDPDDPDDHNYPFYCPWCDENMFEFETTTVTDEEYKERLEDSVERFFFIKETDILLSDEKIFGDNEEHSYDIMCYNGHAIALASDDSDAKAPRKLDLKYPKIKELDEESKKYILKYRGLNDVSPDDITFGDVMIAFGKIVSFSPQKN